MILLGGVLAAGAACGGSGDTSSGGKATVLLDGTSFAVNGVTLSFAAGEDGYFRIDGDDAANPGKDCVPGLTGGLALYGSLPGDITSVQQLAGRELPFEFTGDSDEANLCFVGSNGLLGVERGTVRFVTADQGTVTFSFSGDFLKYDGEGGDGQSQTASGSGVAHVQG
jgi:hypothetical protein